MKTFYEFRFFRDEFEKIKDAPWKYISKSSNEMAVVIKISKDKPESEKILNWAKKHKRSVIAMGPTCEKVFLKSELDSAEVFYVNRIDDAPGEMYGEDYGTQYNIVHRYKQYKIQKQASYLYCNTSKLSRKKDFQRLFSSEIVISRRLKELLEKEHLTGFKVKPILRPIKILNRGDIDEILNGALLRSQDFYQLEILSSCGHIPSPPTIFGQTYIDLDKDSNQVSYIPAFNLIEGISWESNLYLNKFNWPNVDIAHTDEIIMSEYPYPLMILSSKAYKIFTDNGIKGFKAEPAYFV